jgi:hypothetical protein
VLHIVPTAWNGQLLAVFALDAAFASIAVGIVYGWTRSLRGAAAAFLAIVAFAAVHPQILVSGWMPHLYVLTFFLSQYYIGYFYWSVPFLAVLWWPSAWPSASGPPRPPP